MSETTISGMSFNLAFSPLPCLQEMIDEADRNGDGQIDEDEFYRIMKKTSLF